MLLGYLDDYELTKRFEPFEKLADQIERIESDLRIALFFGDTKRIKQKEKELTSLRKEVKLIKNKQEVFW